MVWAGRITEQVRELVRSKRKHEWVEFKSNMFNADQVGANISALANSAAIEDQPNGFVVCGIEDGTGRSSAPT